MGHNIRWLTPDKTILILTIPEYWTVEEMRLWMQDIGRILNKHDHPTTVMLDFQYSTYLPRNVSRQIPMIIDTIHEKAEPILFVRLSPTHRAVLGVIKRIHRNIGYKISIIEDADEIL